jgi:DNA-binding transcriptional LysR family regulator
VVTFADVDLRELRIFLALAEQLHFGRTAERLGIYQSSVSEADRLLERRLGTRLFERTSHKVRLTPVGAGLRERLAPALETLDRALAATREAVNGVSGVLRIATTETTLLPPVLQLISAFEAAHPACTTRFISAPFGEMYSLLRCGEADVLVNWLALDEPDLTQGPAIAFYDRVLAVGRGHRLVGRETVSAEELADERLDRLKGPFPEALLDAIIPPRTPSGRLTNRVPTGSTVNEGLVEIVLGRVVHPTMRGIAHFERDDIVLIPIDGLPPLPLGLIWRTAAENARIRTLAEVACSQGPWPATADAQPASSARHGGPDSDAVSSRGGGDPAI